MAKFFRKTRQQLLAENKLRKYFIYAVGELGMTQFIATSCAYESLKTMLKMHLYPPELLQTGIYEVIITAILSVQKKYGMK